VAKLLGLKMALKRYYKPDLICQLRQSDSVAKLLGLKMALKRYYKPVGAKNGAKALLQTRFNLPAASV
jgi:hypothetical protein